MNYMKCEYCGSSVTAPKCECCGAPVKISRRTFYVGRANEEDLLRMKPGGIIRCDGVEQFVSLDIRLWDAQYQ